MDGLKSCFNKETDFTSCEHLHVLHLHTNHGPDTNPKKHAFKTNDPSSQACRKRPLGLFSKEETFHHYLHFGDQINFSQVNIASHACQSNQPYKLITHTCSNTRKSSTCLSPCTSCLCMHFILQISLKHIVLSKLK